MFHLILTVCLVASGSDCAPILLPQGDAATRQGCLDRAPRIAQDWLATRPDLTGGASDCVANADLPALELRPVAPGVTVHPGQSRPMEDTADGRIANLGVVIGDDAVAVIDAGTGRAQGQALYVAIRRLTDKPIAHLILTHMHPDHVLGAAVMSEAGAQVLAHDALPQGLQSRAGSYLDLVTGLFPPAEWIGTQLTLPDRTVTGQMQVDLGGRVLDLTAWPPAHSDNDLTVFDRGSKVLFTGDLVFRDLTPVVEGSLQGWLDWMDRPPVPQPSRIVPGHGPVADSWDIAATPQRDLLTALAAQTRAAIAAGGAMSDAVPMIAGALRPFGEIWTGFDTTIARDATVAFKELEWE